MDVTSPAAACPHCGLPLDVASVRPSAAPPLDLFAQQLTADMPALAPDALVPAACGVTVMPEPIAENEAAPADPWATFVINEPQDEPAEAPAPPAVSLDVVDEPPTAAPVAVRLAAMPEPPPLVAEFAPLYIHAETEPAVAPPPPLVEQEPWITVEPGAAAEPLAEAQLPEPADAVIDTGRGWGIRDLSGNHPAAHSPADRGGRGPGVAPAAQPPPRTVAGRARAIRLAVTAAALAVLLAVTYVGVEGGALSRVFGGGSRLAAPHAIGSLTQVNGAQTDQLLASVRADVRTSSSTEAVAAVYGKGATPELVFVAYSGAATQTPDQLVAMVNASGTPFTQAPKVSTVGGQQYVCGRVGAPASPSVICTWTDSRAAGYVYAIGTGDVGGALHLAAVARTSSEAGS